MALRPTARFDIKATDKTKGAFNSVNSQMTRLAKNAVRVSGAIAALGFARAVVVAAKFEKSISELSAITGATGTQLKFLSDEARKMGAATTLSASQAAEAFKLVASGKPELLESSEALAAVTREVVTLAEAAGIEMPEAADALTAALNQFSAGADEANRFINVLAAGSKFGASTIEQTSEALEKAGTVASIAGISFEELNANIQGLAAVAIKGSDAGTALRNAILKLQNQANPEFNPAIVGLTQAFKNLSKSGLGTVDLMNLVGLRTIAATQALLKQADGLETLEGKITGTNVAQEQAAIRTDNLIGDMLRLNAAFEEASITLIDRLNPSLRSAAQAITQVINAATAETPEVELLQEKFKRMTVEAINLNQLMGAEDDPALIAGYQRRIDELRQMILITNKELIDLGTVVPNGDDAPTDVAKDERGAQADADLEAARKAAQARELKTVSDGVASKLEVIRTGLLTQSELAREAVQRDLDVLKKGQDLGILSAQQFTDMKLGVERASQEKINAVEIEGMRKQSALRISMLRFNLQSEQDAENEAFQKRLADLNQRNAQGLVSISTFQSEKEQLEAAHQSNMAEISGRVFEAQKARSDANLAVIQASLQVSQDAETAAFQNKLAMLEKNRSLDLISLQTLNAMKEKFQGEHNIRMADLEWEALGQLQERAAAKLESIRFSLLSEQEAENEAFQNKLLVLEENRALQLISQQTFNSMKEQLEAVHQNKIANIEKKAGSGSVKLRQQISSQIIGIIRQLGSKSEAFAKAALVIEAVIAAKKIFIEGQVAAAAALVPPPVGLGPIAGQPLAAAILAATNVSAGLALASGALSLGSFGNSSGGSGGGAFGATPVVPIDPITGLTGTAGREAIPTAIEVTVNLGDPGNPSTEYMRNFIDLINEQQEDGAVIKSIRVA